MKTIFKNVLFVIICIVVIVGVMVLKIYLQEVGKPSAVVWVAVLIIPIVYSLMFGFKEENKS